MVAFDTIADKPRVVCADGRGMRLIVRLTHPGGVTVASRLRIITVFEA